MPMGQCHPQQAINVSLGAGKGMPGATRNLWLWHAQKAQLDDGAFVGHGSTCIGEVGAGKDRFLPGLQYGSMVSHGSSIHEQDGSQVLLGQRSALGDGFITDALQDVLPQLQQAMLVAIGNVIRVMQSQGDRPILTVLEGFASRFCVLDRVPDDLPS